MKNPCLECLLLDVFYCLAGLDETQTLIKPLAQFLLLPAERLWLGAAADVLWAVPASSAVCHLGCTRARGRLVFWSAVTVHRVAVVQAQLGSLILRVTLPLIVV